MIGSGEPAMAKARRFAAWSALIAAPLAWLNIVLYLAVSGGDTALLFDPVKALSLTPGTIDLFRLGQLLDSFGYYLPMLPIGAYLCAKLRGGGGPLVDAALLSLVIYIMLGIVGTSIQTVALPLLAEIHKSTDPVARAGSETAWLLIVHIAQRAVWWMEGPTFAFWAIITGAAMRAQGLRFGRFLMALGCGYALYFLLVFVRADTAAELVELVAVLPVPLWLILLGLDLWRARTW